MNKKIIYCILLSLPVLIMARMPEVLSFGAPVSSSGAPGEVTCAASGCHDDAPVNAGNAVLSVKVGDNITNYVPGETYPVTVRISEQDVKRFGFQLVALKNSDHSNAGDLSITDVDRTQLLKNDIALTDRKYATYTYEGTEPYAPGVGEWTMNWTAPEKGAGPVTLYIGAVSANNDNKDKGDHVYTTSVILAPSDVTSINKHAAELNVTVFANSASKELNVRYALKNAARVTCSLYTVQGKLVKTLFEETAAAAEKKIAVDVPGGIYLVRLMADEKVKTTKIIIQ